MQYHQTNLHPKYLASSLLNPLTKENRDGQHKKGKEEVDFDQTHRRVEAPRHGKNTNKSNNFGGFFVYQKKKRELTRIFSSLNSIDRAD